MTFDIALVKLDRDIQFIPGVLESICLPVADDRSDIVEGEGKYYDSATSGDFCYKTAS